MKFSYFFLFFLAVFWGIFFQAAAFEFVSQSGQDEFIYEQFFKDKTCGFFVDIGAHDGMTYSNSYFFEKCLGWTGICVEPIPSVFNKLVKNRSCICINGCVADFNGFAPFLLISGYSEMLSGLMGSYDPRHLERVDRELKHFGGEKEIIDVWCFKLEDFLAEKQIFHVDYMSVDTEGSEFEILQAIDFDKIYIDVLSVENNYNQDDTRIFLEARGYCLIKKIGADEIYKKQ